LRIPAGLQIRDSEVGNYPVQDVLCLSTGSQGEPMSAMSRIAIDDHRHLKIAPDDTVVLSARSIPGNEKAIGRVLNHLARRGANVVYEGIKHVHVSGHGSEEELKLMLSLVRPRYFVPVHGEYRQLAQHARVAGRVFSGRDPRPEVLLIEDGDLLHFDGDGGRIGGKAPVGRVLIDGTRTGEVADEVLRDRRHLAEDGLVVPVVAINKQTGTLEGVPEIITRGFVMENGQELLAAGVRLLSDTMEQTSVEERTDPGLIKERLRVELRRFLRKRSGRRPFVLPVIMEI
jgi:ribonuclease J